MGFLNKLFASASIREVKRVNPLVDKVIALEDEYKALSDESLKAKTPAFKARIEAGESLDDILPEAFAAVREAAARVLGMRPYRVQIVGGIILHQGRISEMKTGEGKTLVAILPAYLNALSGNGVHIVTVNDYLARRDSEWMGKVYRFMGMEVGLIIHGKTPAQRKVSYDADITYCTNNELGFDYLRDNMATYSKELVQRPHNFAIVDEVDSILVDEARTPLIISGKGDDSTKLYELANNLVSRMKKMVFVSTESKESQDDFDCDYIVDEKSRSTTLTAKGITKAEGFFGLENLADAENATISHHINQAMKARGLMNRDTDYVVNDGQVIIVDEFTGRLMFGRRYNEGLHQAIEAKEGVKVANESKTLATITFQNFFRLYNKLSGMTGTALTEAEEFGSIYALDVVEIPTNVPIARMDKPDLVYKTIAAKDSAVIEQVKACHEKGQPVLVGTISIESSEYLSSLLKKTKVPHTVLNAKHHEKEAEIVAQAGKFGAVTIATNMAGRGTDIVLGGNAEFMAKDSLRKSGMEEALIAETTSFADGSNPDIAAARVAYQQAYDHFKTLTTEESVRVRDAGGLYIIGTERHESRRIDNQLRGRAGRQGDPGVTQFYLSLEDDIMRLFGGDRMDKIGAMMTRLKMDEDTPIDAKMLSGAIENSQKTVESRNFQVRKNVLDYDDVMNTQRKVIYEQRKQVLDGDDLKTNIEAMLRFVVGMHVDTALEGANYLADRAQLNGLVHQFEGLYFPKDTYEVPEENLSKMTKETLIDGLYQACKATYDEKEEAYTAVVMRELERVIMLRVVDEYWMENIDAMHDLRQGIGLRAYGQANPVDAYKKEGFEMFDGMVCAIREETIRRLFAVRLKSQEELKREKVAKVTFEGGNTKMVKKQPIVKKIRVGRNDPCHCGSGKKYKHCCIDKDLEV